MRFLQTYAGFRPARHWLVIDADLTYLMRMSTTCVLEFRLALTVLCLLAAIGELMLATVDIDFAYIVKLAASLGLLAGDVTTRHQYHGKKYHGREQIRA